MCVEKCTTFLGHPVLYVELIYQQSAGQFVAREVSAAVLVEHSEELGRSVLALFHELHHFLHRRHSLLCSRQQTWNWVIGSPGQWVIWVIFHVRVSGSPGHHFDPVRDPSFSGLRKMPKMQNVHLNC